MSSEDNKQNARDGYEAFIAGDAEGAMTNIADSIVFIAKGDNTVAGTYTGKQEVGGYWEQLGEAGFTTAPRKFLADGDTVVVLTTQSGGGDNVEAADVLTYDNDAQLVRFESFGGEPLVDRLFAK